MNRPLRKLVPVLLAALAVAASCGGGASEPTDQPTLFADLTDFKIELDHASVPAGRVVFGIRNHAAMLHELKVIKTDLAPDQLPLDTAAAKAKEDGKVGGLENIPAGASRKLAIDLAPGKYVVICNVAGHYQLGMHVGLEVK